MDEAHELTEDELRQLASRWGIETDADELSSICERVNRRLRSVTAVEALEPRSRYPATPLMAAANRRGRPLQCTGKSM